MLLSQVTDRSEQQSSTTDNRNAKQSMPTSIIHSIRAQRGFTDTSDEALVGACRRGSATAWETLVTRYQRLIYAIPRRAGLDEDQAAEILQRVFTILFERLNDIEQPDRIRAWLVTTARRETWHLIRRKRAAETPDIDGAAIITDEVPDNAPLPDEVLLRLEQQHEVRAAICALDERCRKLLTLLFYQPEPPTYADIAALLDTSEGSIGPTRARCLQKLCQLLDEAGFEYTTQQSAQDEHSEKK